MSNADEFLFASGWEARAEQLEDAAWLAIARRVTEQLSTAIGRPLELDPAYRVHTERGFSIEVRSVAAEHDLLALAVRGTVGAQIHDDRLLIRAWLFLYCRGQRIAAPRAETLVLVYVDQSGGRWQAHGWYHGDMGEFDEYATFEPSSD